MNIPYLDTISFRRHLTALRQGVKHINLFVFAYIVDYLAVIGQIARRNRLDIGPQLDQLARSSRKPSCPGRRCHRPDTQPSSTGTGVDGSRLQWQRLASIRTCRASSAQVMVCHIVTDVTFPPFLGLILMLLKDSLRDTAARSEEHTSELQ